MTYVEDMQAEVDAEPGVDPADPYEGSIELPIADTYVHITPPGGWRASAMEAINRGNWNVWARACLAGDDYEQIWLPLDPTNDEIEDMLISMRQIVGQSMGESRASRRGSKRTRGR